MIHDKISVFLMLLAVSAPAFTATADQAKTAVSAWPQDAKLVADRLIYRHGPPDEAAPDRLRWKGGRLWLNLEVRPLVSGMLTESVRYRCPGQCKELIDNLGLGVTYDAKGRTLTATADSEEAALLALNMAAETAEGKRTQVAAQDFYRKTLDLQASGKTSNYTRRLLFEPYRKLAMPFWLGPASND